MISTIRGSHDLSACRDLLDLCLDLGADLFLQGDHLLPDLLSVDPAARLPVSPALRAFRGVVDLFHQPQVVPTAENLFPLVRAQLLVALHLDDCLNRNEVVDARIFDGLARVLIHELDLVERCVDDLRPLEDLPRRSRRIGVGTSALVRRDLERVVGRVEPFQLRQLQLGLVRERRPLLRQLVSLGLHLRLFALTLQLRDLGVELIDQSASGVDLDLQQFLRPRLRIGRGRGIRLICGAGCLGPPGGVVGPSWLGLGLRRLGLRRLGLRRSGGGLVLRRRRRRVLD